MRYRVMPMKDKSTSYITLVPTENKRKKRILQLVCSVITYFALAVIVLLSIPICLLIGAIGGIWSVTDKIVERLSLSQDDKPW